MTDLTDTSNLELLRKIIREEVPVLIRQEVPPIVREIIREEVPPMVRSIVREETTDMREDLKLVKDILGQHSLQLRTINSTLNSIKTTQRSHGNEIHQLRVLYDDLNNRFKTPSEAH